ncbi:MAG TPA: hypothetical protein VFF49_06640 [Thermodesulfobacteriota bacterium]|nr:hypothetical protein [Thermodesulfobacteriota bacterium]
MSETRYEFKVITASLVIGEVTKPFTVKLLRQFPIRTYNQLADEHQVIGKVKANLLDKDYADWTDLILIRNTKTNDLFFSSSIILGYLVEDDIPRIILE